MVNERYSDRIMVIPWKPMDVSDPSALQTKANEYTAYVSQEARPTEYTIGEMGDYLRRCVKENHLSCIAFSKYFQPRVHGGTSLPTLRYWSTWMCFFKLLSSSAIIGNQNKNSLFLFYRCQVKTVILIFSNITVIELLG